MDNDLQHSNLLKTLISSLYEEFLPYPSYSGYSLNRESIDRWVLYNTNINRNIISFNWFSEKHKSVIVLKLHRVWHSVISPCQTAVDC